MVNEETYNTIVGYIYDYSREAQRENGCDYRKTLSEILDGYVEMVHSNSSDALFFAEMVANVDILDRVVSSCYQGKRSTAQRVCLICQYNNSQLFLL